MPYSSRDELPDQVKNNTPPHAQDIYKEAFSSALKQYGEEERAHRVAWNAVKQKYEKGKDGNWHLKNS